MVSEPFLATLVTLCALSKLSLFPCFYSVERLPGTWVALEVMSFEVGDGKVNPCKRIE